MVAIDERASMLCARVMRGISSMERKLTPRSARLRAASSAVSGSPKPITVCPRRICARSCAPVSGLAPGLRTCSTTSAVSKISSRPAMRTPLAAYSESGKPAWLPAPASRINSAPVLFSTESAVGTMATLRSPGASSATIPTLIPIEPLLKSLAPLTYVRGSEGVRVLPSRDREGAVFTADLYQFRGAEEEPELHFRGLRSVRPVYAVALDIGGEPLANRTLRRVGGVGGAHHFA